MRAWLRSLQDKIQNLDGETQQLTRLVLAACAAAGGRVLDVGCGYGRLLSLLHAAGVEATGVEINPQIAATVRSAGLRCMTAEEFNASQEQYDVVLMSHVIEHFAPAELLSFMDAYLDRLKPGGRLVIATPLMSDYFYDDFDHIRPYQPAGIQMVFGEGAAQVQYYSRNKLALRDLWFRRSPKRISYARARYVPTRAYWILFALDLLASGAFLLSARLFGTTNGWVGVFEKTR
jgi:SAM-dependent methyltransferase